MRCGSQQVSGADRDQVPRAAVEPGPVRLRPGRPAARASTPIVGENTISRGRASVRMYRDPIATAQQWRAKAEAENLSIRELIIEVTGRQSFIGSPPPSPRRSTASSRRTRATGSSSSRTSPPAAWTSSPTPSCRCCRSAACSAPSTRARRCAIISASRRCSPASPSPGPPDPRAVPGRIRLRRIRGARDLAEGVYSAAHSEPGRTICAVKQVKLRADGSPLRCWHEPRRAEHRRCAGGSGAPTPDRPPGSRCAGTEITALIADPAALPVPLSPPQKAARYSPGPDLDFTHGGSQASAEEDRPYRPRCNRPRRATIGTCRNDSKCSGLSPHHRRDLRRAQGSPGTRCHRQLRHADGGQRGHCRQGGRHLRRAHGPRSAQRLPLGLYDVTVEIVTFEPGQEIAWTVHGQLDLGHVYGYRLEPINEGTLVTSYYDWSAAEQSWKEAAIFPVIPESALRATLGILARTVARKAPARTLNPVT